MNRDTRYYKKRCYSKGAHIPNKNEAQLLRKIMSETGLTEEEIRESKKYRVMLSEAQKEGVKAKRTKKQKKQDDIMKSVTKDLKLAKEHPLVVAEFKVRWDNWFKKYGHRL